MRNLEVALFSSLFYAFQDEGVDGARRVLDGISDRTITDPALQVLLKKTREHPDRVLASAASLEAHAEAVGNKKVATEIVAAQSPANAWYGIVATLSEERAKLRLVTRINEISTGIGAQSVGEMAGALARAMDELVGGVGWHDGVPMDKLCSPIVKAEGLDYDAACLTPYRGVRVGFSSVEHVMGRVLEGDLMVIGGHTSHGKTTLALNLATRMAMMGTKVFYISLEMTPEMLSQKLVALMMNHPWGGLFGGNPDKPMWRERWPLVRDTITQLPIMFYSKPIRSADVFSIVANGAFLSGFDVVFLDYIHLVGDGADYVTVSDVVTKAKEVAGKHRKHVVALSQMNRNADQAQASGRGASRVRRPPQLSDLRQSGVIEQVADTVLLLDPLSARADSRDFEGEVVSEVNLIIAKRRFGGRTGVAKSLFFKSRSLFIEQTPIEDKLLDLWMEKGIPLPDYDAEQPLTLGDFDG